VRVRDVTRRDHVASIDRAVDAGLDPNLRGFATRIPESRHYREPCRGSCDPGPSDAEIAHAAHHARVRLRGVRGPAIPGSPEKDGGGTSVAPVASHAAVAGPSPGTVVHLDVPQGGDPREHVYEGVVLARDDPRAWRATVAFPVTAGLPDADDVRTHVVRCLESGLLRDRVPVLWSHGVVYWERADRLLEGPIPGR